MVHPKEKTLSTIIRKEVEKCLNEAKNPIDDLNKTSLVEYTAWLRALHLWFHGAHHIVSGPSFSGDHVNLYQKFYEEIQTEIDGAIEKIVGVTNDKSLACPLCLTTKANEILQKYRSPRDLSPTNIASVGLQMEKNYLEFLDNLFETLELKNMLTLGLNDQLAASANVHEKYVYLLQQRIKKSFEEY